MQPGLLLSKLRRAVEAAAPLHCMRSSYGYWALPWFRWCGSDSSGLVSWLWLPFRVKVVWTDAWNSDSARRPVVICCDPVYRVRDNVGAASIPVYGCRCWNASDIPQAPGKAPPQDHTFCMEAKKAGAPGESEGREGGTRWRWQAQHDRWQRYVLHLQRSG